MGTCTNHPEKETSMLCSKHGVYMCEACLACRDPKIYCKFRSACPIWYEHKRKARKQREEEERAAAAICRVTFESQHKTVEVEAGDTILSAALKGDVHINASCNGKGACGKCKIVLKDGPIETESTALLSDLEKERNYLLACRTKVTGDVVVAIPQETMERRLKVAGLGREATQQLKERVAHIEPMLQEIAMQLEPPTLEDSVSDLDRLKRGLKRAGCDIERMNVGLKVMQDLASVMRNEHWKVTAAVIRKKCSNEVLQVRPGNGQPESLGTAIDVGTTSVVVYLVSMQTGDILAATSGHNRQAACGDDVINRIICAENDGVAKLSNMVLDTINNLIGEALDSILLQQAGLGFGDVERVWISGGFGQYFNIEKAVTIGLLPDIDRSRFQYLGNSSVSGAYMALLSDACRREALEVSANMTYIDFSSNPRFMDEFTSAQFLPHTDLNAFPSVHVSKKP